MMTEYKWIVSNQISNQKTEEIANNFQLPISIATLLMQRGLQTCEEVELFLHPRLRNLSDPYLLPEMEKAVDRIQLALEKKEPIVLFGDYDVDGVTSLALLTRILESYGGIVNCFLPLRIEEGYGISRASLERCLDRHRPKLFIALDCGTNSVKEVAFLKKNQIDVLIVDHHESTECRPEAIALINPKASKTNFTYLCTAGLVFKLAHALFKRVVPGNFNLKSILDLVAMATLCDLVPLVEENRILVHSGLAQMEKTCWPGLCALLEISKVSSPISSTDIGFRIGPRINATGRIGTALDSLKLLLTSDVQEAQKLAEALDKQNQERQQVEEEVCVDAENQVRQSFCAERDCCIVLGSRDWHPGVLGIVASRIVRRYHRPTLVIGFNESGAGKGSGRSIKGFSLVEALEICSECLTQFGGHAMAAGLSLQEEQFQIFQKAFEKATRALLPATALTRCLELDVEVKPHEIGEYLLRIQDLLEPFGMENQRPIFYLRNLLPSQEPRVLKAKHLRIAFHFVGNLIWGIYFNGALSPLPKPPWDVAFHFERNFFQSKVLPQINILAIRQAL